VPLAQVKTPRNFRVRHHALAPMMGKDPCCIGGR
jgi:hypothetical protein